MRTVFRDAPLIVWGVTLLHAIIAVMLLLDPASALSTAPAEVVHRLHQNSTFGTSSAPGLASKYSRSSKVKNRATMFVGKRLMEAL